MKTAIVTDSNSGILPEEAEARGIYLLNMPIIAGDREYLENENFTKDAFYELLESGADIKTSQPSAGAVLDLWDQVLRISDELVYIPMSSGLSGAFESAVTYAFDYDGRVEVVNNQRISVTQRQSVLDALAMAEKGFSAAQIREVLERTRFDSRIYIMVDTLTYLKRGGRVTAAGAAIAGILNLKPILQINGEKLDAFQKCRGTRQAKKIMLRTLREDIEREIGPVDPEHPNAWIGMAYTHNRAEAEEFREEVRAAFPGYPVWMSELPLSIAVHIGPGSLAVTWTKILPESMQIGEESF